MLLYDAYNFKLENLQLSAFEQLEDYHHYKTIRQTKIIKDVTLYLKFYYCLELKHPTYPLYEVNMQLQKMDLMASDYVARFMTKLQEAVMAKLPKPEPKIETAVEDHQEATPSKKSGQQSSKSKNIEIVDESEEFKSANSNQIEMVGGFNKKNNQSINIQSSVGSQKRRQKYAIKGMSGLNMSIKTEDELEFKSCVSGDTSFREQDEDDLASHRSLPSNARIQMIKKMPQKQIEALKNMRTKDQISVNVVVSINELTINIMEEISEDDPILSNPQILLQSAQSERPHRELLCMRMNELIASFNQDTKGIQKIKFILNCFDIQDRLVEISPSSSTEHSKLQPAIPDIYSHIIGNPDFTNKVQSSRTEEESLTIRQHFSNLNRNNDQGQNSRSYRLASSANYSVMSMEFKSCVSGSSQVSMNVNEIERMSQIYMRALIDPDPFQTKTEVDLIFSDLRLIVSFATFQKLFEFSKKLQPQQSEEERMSQLFDEQQKRFLVDRIHGSTQGGEHSSRTTRISSKVIAGQIQNTKLGGVQKKIQEIKIKRTGKDSYTIYTSERKSKLKFSGRFKNLSLWIPLDETNQFSRVLTFSLMTQVNYRKDAVDIDFTNSVTRDVILTQNQSSREDAIVTLNQLQILMVNRHLMISEEEDPSIEKLLEPSRITLTYENLIKDKGLNSWMNVDILVEPFELKVGFREIEFFQKLNDRVQKFLAVITQTDDMLDMTLDTEVDLEKELRKFRHQELKELSNAVTNTKNEKRTKIRKEEQIKVMTVKFRCDTFRFSLMDDTGLQEYPVIFMNVRNVKYDSKVYEDIDDAAVFILKKMGIMKKKNDDEEPYLNTHASVNLEVYYFNMKIQAYEPVFEPWQLEFSQFQEERYISQRTNIKSDQMLNMNVTFALMEAITNIQKRLAQTSEDWEDEFKGSQGDILSKRETLKQSTLNRQSVNLDKVEFKNKNSQIFVDNSDTQNGFIFINRLNIDCRFYVEGQQAHDLKKQIVMGLFGNQNQLEESKEFNLEDAMNLIDDNDPKAHFKKLALIRKMNMRKRTLDKTIEKETYLSKQGLNMRKFRRADELFYLMKQIKNGESGSSYMPTFDDQILRVDLQIEGLKKIKGVPIELGGVRSFLLDIKQDQRNVQTDFNTIKPIPQTISSIPVAIICKVQFENQSKKEVEFQSSLILSNNSDQSIVIASHYNSELKIKSVKRGSFMQKHGQLSLEDIPVEKQYVIEPNKVFYVPLSWFIKRKSIFIKAQFKFELLFPDIREHFNPILAQYKHLKPSIFDISSDLGQSKYISCNIAMFKCKPTTLNIPGQFLVTFTPPVCFSNYLFNDLRISTSNQKQLCEIPSQSYTYIDEIKFEDNEKGLGCGIPVTFSFSDQGQTVYTSEESPLFKQVKLNQNLTGSVRNQIFLINQRHQHSLLSQDSIQGTLKDESSQCILDIELSSFNLLQNEYDNFDLREKVFEVTTAVKLFVYPQAMIVNKTNCDLFIRTSVTSNKQKIVRVKAQSNEFFYSSSNKAQLTASNYQWSKVFDVSTLGLSGALEIIASKEGGNLLESQQLPILNFGILIENGMNQFSKTKIIKIVPRYLIFNNLDDPIIVRQKNQQQQLCIYPKDRQVFNFQQKQKDVFLAIRDMDKQNERVDHIMDEFTQKDEVWSSPFSIEDIEDFQVGFSSNYYKNERRYENQGKLMGMLLGSSQGKKKVIWHMPNDSNYQQRIVRVSISTQDDATIFVIISKPKFPEYYIFNNTDVEICFNQLKSSEDKKRTIKPGQKVPFIWNDQTQAVKKIVFQIDGKQQTYAIDKIKRFEKDFTTPRDQYFVEVMTTGDVRTVELRSKSVELRLASQREKGSSKLAKMFLASFLKKGFIFNVDLKGFGMSLIDNEPKEIIYFSIYKINALMEKWSEQVTRRDATGQDEQIQEAVTKYDLRVGHIQIDNIMNDQMPVFFCPTKELSKQLKLTEEELILKQASPEDETPFIQVMITFSEIQEKDSYIKKYRGLQIQIQEMKIELETGLVNALLKFALQISSIRNQESQFISGYTYKQHQLTRGLSKNKNGSFGGQAMFSREAICESLQSQLPNPPDMTEVTARKTYFEFVNFGAIKCKITVRFENQAFELKIDDPKQGFGIGSIFYTLFTSVATISDSPLTFKELILMHTFTSQQNLISMVTRNYTRQGILQFYKLLGSSDLLGNPVGLIDKLGTGVFEFFNEPRKGLVKGPKEFVGGVGKGVKSLVTNIVSGSFDSVSKITGSLYGVIKNVSGDEVNQQQIKRPEHTFDGIYQGVMGGAGEIVSGLAGIFTKPYQKARQEGAKGFVKGLGSGLIGAMASPFTATLRLGTNISTGIKNSAIRLGKGKLPQYGRFRHPRYFNSKSILEPYAEAFAEANQILRTLNNGRFSNSTIRFFSDFSQQRGRDLSQGILIITDQNLLYVKDFKNLVYFCQLEQVLRCEVYQENIKTSIKSQKKAAAQKVKEEKKSNKNAKGTAASKNRGRGMDESELQTSNAVLTSDQSLTSGGALGYQEPIKVKYHIHVEAQKKGMLKLENENYPIADKVYTILTK